MYFSIPRRELKISEEPPQASPSPDPLAWIKIDAINKIAMIIWNTSKITSFHYSIKKLKKPLKILLIDQPQNEGSN